MRIGTYLRLFGRPGTTPPPPSWASLREAAVAAEAAGFDRIVLEDGLLYVDDDGNLGLWDPIAIAAGIAAATSRIGISHAVINSPYRHPAIVARAAATLDEMSGGRYSLGIGLGNTPDDYARFGIAADQRASRFEESIQVITELLRTGRSVVHGTFVDVPDGELVLRGPRPGGPPIVIAAAKPRALRLAARYADEWNWWSTEPENPDGLTDIVAELERACADVGRDPASLARSVDVYSLGPPGEEAGSAEKLAATILDWGRLGFGEVRINVRAPDGATAASAITAMRPVVEQVRSARA